MANMGGYTVLNEDADMYDIVRGAEVCSIETAKSLGLFDNMKYYKGEAETNVRTFSPNISRDAERPFRLCQEMSEDQGSRPICSLIAPGLIPKGDGTCGRPDGECPPGFTYDASAKACTKPLQRVKINRASHCAPQWHDWFTIPNYSMSNGYEMVDGVCNLPCMPNMVPIRGTDPLTGKSRGDDALGKCVDKMEYLGGKFGGDPDFCNLAWIKRLSVKWPDLLKEHQDKYPEFASFGSETISQAAQENVVEILRETLKPPQNLSANTENADALSKSIETPERLNEAYGICEDILRNPGQAQAKYLEDMRRTIKLINPNIDARTLDTDILNRYRVLKQACHWTFCDNKMSQSSKANSIGKPSLCFPASDIERIDLKPKDSMSVALDAQPGEYPEQYNEIAPIATERRIVQNIVQKIVKMLLWCVTMLALVMGIWLIVDAIINPLPYEHQTKRAIEINSATKFEMAKAQRVINATNANANAK